MTLEEAKQSPMFAGMSDSDLRSLGFDPGYQSPELIAYNQRVADAASAYRGAFERWRAANPNADQSTYNPRHWLPSGFKDLPLSQRPANANWYDSAGNVIQAADIGWGNIYNQLNQQVAETGSSVVSAPGGGFYTVSGKPSNIGTANPFLPSSLTGSKITTYENPAATIPTSVISNTVGSQSSSNMNTPLGTFQSQGGPIGQQAIAAEDTGKTPSWMDNIYNTKQSGSTIPSWQQLFG